MSNVEQAIARHGPRALSIGPATQLAVAIANASMVVLGARHGQFGDIAAYSVGTSSLAVLGVVVGGGTALVFVTGSDNDRAAVRRVRWRVITPLHLVACLILVLLLMAFRPQLSSTALAFGGISVVLNALTAMETADLQRLGRMGRWSACTVSAKLLGIAVIVFGGSYSAGMILSAALGLCGLALLNPLRGHAPSRVPNSEIWGSLRVALKPSFASISVLDVIVLRMPFFVIGFVATPELAGAFATLLTLALNLANLIASGLYTIMTARSGHPVDQRLHYLARYEAFATWSAAPLAIVSAVASPLVTSVLHLDGFAHAKAWWIGLSLAILPLILNRRTQYRAMSVQRPSAAVALLGVICAAQVAGSSWAAASTSLLWLSFTPLVAETVGVMASPKLWARYALERRS